MDVLFEGRTSASGLSFHSFGGGGAGRKIGVDGGADNFDIKLPFFGEEFLEESGETAGLEAGGGVGFSIEPVAPFHKRTKDRGLVLPDERRGVREASVIDDNVPKTGEAPDGL